MRKKFFKVEFIFFLFLILSVFAVYRDVFLKNRIAFPSNLLASFYSPWVTQKFADYPYGIPNKPIGGNDQVRMFYPYRTFINEEIRRGELPLWNPYNFSGSPLLANFQSAVFYPLNLIYLVIPQVSAWTLLVMIQPLLGAFLMYLYLSLFIKEKTAVFLGSIAFGFSGFILAWSQENAVVGQVALWLPLVLLGAEKFAASPNFKHFLILSLSLAITVLAGHPQIAFYIFFVAFCYGIFRIFHFQSKRVLSFILFFFGSFLISFILSAVQLLPSIEAFRESTRAYSSIQPVLDNYLLPLKYYITVLAPDIFGNPGTYNFFGNGFYHEKVFYIGIIPLFFALLAVFKIRKNNIVNFFTALSVVSFFLGFDNFFSHWFYHLSIPVVSTFTPSRIFYVTSASLAVLSSLGMSYWLKNGTRKLWKTMYFIIFIFSAILLTYIGPLYLATKISNNLVINAFINIFSPIRYQQIASISISARNMVLPFSMLFFLFVLTLFSNKRKFTAFVIVLIALLGQLYFLNKYVVLGDKKLMYPDHFVFSDILTYQDNANRFVSYGLPIVGDIGLQKHVYSPDGIDPVFPKRYGQLIYASKNDGRFTLDIPRIEVAISDYSETLNILNNNRRLKLLSLLGVSRIYNYEGNYKDLKILENIFPSDYFSLLWKRDNWQAYQLIKALPRVFFVDNYKIEKNPQKSMDLIFDPEIDLRKTVVLEETPPKLYPQDNNPSGQIISQDRTETKVKIESYEPQKVKLSANTNKDRILFLSDTYYPGWNAYVDSKQVKIYIADYAFRAIIVPAGSHTVTFIFRPQSFKYGLFLTLSALLILSVLIVFRHFSKKR